jgi:hypothetical protein
MLRQLFDIRDDEWGQSLMGSQQIELNRLKRENESVIETNHRLSETNQTLSDSNGVLASTNRDLVERIARLEQMVIGRIDHLQSTIDDNQVGVQALLSRPFTTGNRPLNSWSWAFLLFLTVVLASFLPLTGTNFE